MTENYQHRKPPTFEDEELPETPPPERSEPAADLGTPFTPPPTPPVMPASPATIPVNVQRGRAPGAEPVTYATQPPNVPTATAQEATSGGPASTSPAPSFAPTPTQLPPPGVPRVVVVPSKQVAPRPMAPETTLPASEREAVWSGRDNSKVTPVTWIMLGCIALLALALRLREPLSSPIMGAEDPYLHMQRTWNLVQGSFPRDYPVGFMILLAPFTLLGPDTFYLLARFLPALAGPVLCVGMFLFLRNYMLAPGALTASMFLAVMPEMIVRTNLLFPTAIDLAVLPFLFLAFFRLVEGQRWAMYAVIGMTLGLLLVHPWFVALMLPPMAAFGLIILVTHHERRTWATSGSIAGLLGIVGVVWLFRQFQPATLLSGFSTKFFEVLGNPAMVVTDPPVHVNLSYMITIPAILLAIVGAVYSVMHRSRIGILALLWTLMLLPLTLVDWFGIWYIPHRTVAYAAVGIAILAGIAVAEVVHKFTKANINLRVPATIGVLVLVAILTIPSAVAIKPWYRIYDADDFDAFETLDALDADFVMCGSWQARAGYRSLTAREADFMPQFFTDENMRAVRTGEHPGLYVLVDNATVSDGRDVSFLDDDSQWELIQEFNNDPTVGPHPVKIYRHRS